MRFLILNTDYGEFLRWLYTQHPELETQPYAEQMRARNESLFGVADFYSSNLRKLGHEAWDIHANNEYMQAAWAREHGVHMAPRSRWQYRVRGGVVPWVSRVKDQRWLYDILAAQIRHYRPDVLLNQAMDHISGRILGEMKQHARMLVGQIAAPLPKHEDLRVYDLVISSLPNFVEHFRRLGAPSEVHRLAFEPAILLGLGSRGPDIPVTFVGSVSPTHDTRILWLEYLCQHPAVNVWVNGADSISKNSAIRRRNSGAAWGIEMYRILHRSKITLNHHIGIAESYANNMRLFEATGVGSLLITDWKVNLHEMFQPGTEVIAYRTPEECMELIRYYLEHDDERAAIAHAGQERTLREHTYLQRVRELADIVERHLRQPEVGTRKVFA